MTGTGSDRLHHLKSTIAATTRRRWLELLAVFTLSWSLAFLFLVTSPVTQPRIVVDVTSTSPGMSQVFFADSSGGFTEEMSLKSLVQQGENELTFPLTRSRGGATQSIRWDPVDSPATLDVHSIHLRSLVRSDNIDLTSLTPIFDLSAVTISDRGASFSTESNDPQIGVTYGLSDFLFQVWMLYLVIAAAIAVVTTTGFALWSHLRRDGPRLHTSEANPPREAVAGLPVTPVPKWVAGVTVAILLVAVALLLAGSRAIGVSWDEPIRGSALAQFAQSGWLIPTGYINDGQVDQRIASVYGPLALLLAHSLGFALGVHRLFEFSSSLPTYEVRHLFVALTSLALLCFVAFALKAILKSWRWSLIGLALVASVPLWLGHSMFNIKDAPVAAGFTAFSLGLTLMSMRPMQTSTRVMAALGLGFGALIAFGTRPGIWVALTTSAVLVLLSLFALETRARGTRSAASQLVKQLLALMGVAAFTLIIMWIVYPNIFGTPLAALADAAFYSSEFQSGTATLTAGEMMSPESNPLYVPIWLTNQLPILVLVLALIGVVSVLLQYGRAFISAGSVTPLVALGVPLIAQAVTVPVGGVITGATLYGGLRQVLFIFPAISLLALLGLMAAFSRIDDPRYRVRQTVLWSAVCIGLVVPLISQVRLFPFSFAYFNALAAVSDINRNWEVDGWWSSGREGAQLVSDWSRTACYESEARVTVPCGSLGTISPFLTPDAASTTMSEPTAFVLTRMPSSNDLSHCRTVAQIERPLFGQELVFTRLLDCAVS